jgi:hypothetical protein
MKHRLRQWTAALGVAGALGLACDGPDRAPSAHEREARARVLTELMASREKPPDPQRLQAQRRDLQTEVNPDKALAQGGSGREPPEASTTGEVTWVGNDELLVRDTGGVERDVRVVDDTRFHQGGQPVSRHSVAKGAEVQVDYDVDQGEWVAREVELLRKPPTLLEQGPGAEGLSQPRPR